MMENDEMSMDVTLPNEIPSLEAEETDLDIDEGGEPTNPTPGEEPINLTQPNTGEEANNLTHRVKDRAVTLWVLGDSHLRRRHHFPGLYGQALRDGKPDPRFGPPKRKTEWEDGKRGFAPGLHMDEAYKGQVLDLVESSRGKATAILLSIGTNNICDVPEKSEVQLVVQRIRAILQKVQETPGVFLYLLDPIPYQRELNGVRELLSRDLAAECELYSKARWICLSTGKKAALPEYSPELWEDPRHLNREGAARVLTAFLRAQRGTGSDHFLVDPAAREPRPKERWIQPTKKSLSEKKSDAEEKSGVQGNLHQIRSGKVQKGKKAGQNISPALQARLGSKGQGGRGNPSWKPPKAQPGPKPRRAGAQPSIMAPPPPPPEYYSLAKAKVWEQCQLDIAEIERCERAGVRLGERRNFSEPPPPVRSLLAPPQQPAHHPGTGGNSVGPLGGVRVSYLDPYPQTSFGPNPYLQ